MTHPTLRHKAVKLPMTPSQHSSAALHFFTALDGFIRQPDATTFEHLLQELAIVHVALRMSGPHEAVALNTMLIAAEQAEKRSKPGQISPFNAGEVSSIRRCTHTIYTGLKNVSWKTYQLSRRELDKLIQGQLCQTLTASPHTAPP